MPISNNSIRTAVKLSFMYGMVNQYITDEYLKSSLKCYIELLQVVYSGSVSLEQYRKLLMINQEVDAKVYAVNKDVTKEFIISYIAKVTKEHLDFVKNEQRLSLWESLKQIFESQEIVGVIIADPRDIDMVTYDLFQDLIKYVDEDFVKRDLKAAKAVSQGF